VRYTRFYSAERTGLREGDTGQNAVSSGASKKESREEKLSLSLNPEEKKTWRAAKKVIDVI